MNALRMFRKSGQARGRDSLWGTRMILPVVTCDIGDKWACGYQKLFATVS